jgi:hypothetical protein
MSSLRRDNDRYWEMKIEMSGSTTLPVSLLWRQMGYRSKSMGYTPDLLDIFWRAKMVEGAGTKTLAQ